MPLIGIYDLLEILFFFFLSERNIFDIASCIFKLNDFNYINLRAPSFR